jgi:hypothetical protein
MKAAPRFEEVHGDAEMQPSFMEVVANFQHAAQNGVEECCPCGKGPKPAPAPTPAPTAGPANTF